MARRPIPRAELHVGAGCGGPLKSACVIDRLLAVWRTLAFDSGLGRNLAF